MSIEAALADLTAAVVANTAVLEKLEAGREAALEQLQNKGEAKPRASRKKTEAEEPTGNASGEAAATASQADVATPAAEPSTGVSDDDLRAAATTFVAGTKEKPTTAEVRKDRGAFVKSVTDHFGTKTLVGETGITDPEQRAQALFYIRRSEAGLDVDFSAEYDFAGDPAQSSGSEADSGLDGIG